MRTLACLLKQPSETYQHFNQRLLDACTVLRPTAARCAVVADQPKIDLLASDEDDDPVVRAAVCPLRAANDQAAASTQSRLQQVIAAAQGQPLVTIDSEPPLVTLFLWPLPSAEPEAESAAPPEPDDFLVMSGSRSAMLMPTGKQQAQDESDAEPPSADAEVPSERVDVVLQPAVALSVRPEGGRVPFGLRVRAGLLHEHPEEAPLVRTILRAAAGGSTIDLIEHDLRRDHGAFVRDRWSPKDVPRYIRRILARVVFYRQHLSGLV